MRDLAAFVCFALFMQYADATEGRDVDLILPRALKIDEIVLVEVQLGLLPSGREIEVTTASGRQLGVISPYGVRAGQEAGTFTLPIPSDAFVNRHVVVRLLLKQNGNRQRAPTADEVKSVRVKIAPAVR
jgi:hypothetical protein